MDPEIAYLQTLLYSKCTWFITPEPTSADEIAARLGVHARCRHIDSEQDDLFHPSGTAATRPLTDGLLYRSDAGSDCIVVGVVHNEAQFGILPECHELVEIATTFCARSEERDEDITDGLYLFPSWHTAEGSVEDMSGCLWVDMDPSQRAQFIRRAAARAHSEDDLRAILLDHRAPLLISWHQVSERELHSGQSIRLLLAFAAALGLFLAAGNTALVVVDQDEPL